MPQVLLIVFNKYLNIFFFSLTEEGRRKGKGRKKEGKEGAKVQETEERWKNLNFKIK